MPSPRLASENVTLTTYYPAPSGVYTQMITTQNTYLARDSVPAVGRVGIGTTVLGNTSKVTIRGENNTTTNAALDVQNNAGTSYLFVRNDGNVGHNTNAPTSNLHVIGQNNSGTNNAVATFTRWDNGLSDIAQFYPLNLTQGVAIGYNYIKEIGSNAVNNLTIDAKATGNVVLQANGGTGGTGVGTNGPAGKFAVDGTGGGQRQTVIGDAGFGGGYAGLSVQGSLGTGNYSLLGDGTNLFINRPTGGSIYIRQNNSDQVRIGSPGYIYINNANTSCYTGWVTTGTPDPVSPLCAAGYFSAWTPGLYVEGWSYQNLGQESYGSTPGPMDPCGKTTGQDIGCVMVTCCLK